MPTHFPAVPDNNVLPTTHMSQDKERCPKTSWRAPISTPENWRSGRSHLNDESVPVTPPIARGHSSSPPNWRTESVTPCARDSLHPPTRTPSQLARIEKNKAEADEIYNGIFARLGINPQAVHYEDDYSDEEFEPIVDCPFGPLDDDYSDDDYIYGHSLSNEGLAYPHLMRDEQLTILEEDVPVTDDPSPILEVNHVGDTILPDSEDLSVFETILDDTPSFDLPATVSTLKSKYVRREVPSPIDPPIRPIVAYASERHLVALLKTGFMALRKSIEWILSQQGFRVAADTVGV